MNQVVRRRWARVVTSLVAVAVVLVPSGQAKADDDPGPVQWPKIDQPDAGGGDESDPAPVKWTRITAPENNSDANDPKPAAWPTIAKPVN